MITVLNNGRGFGNLNGTNVLLGRCRHQQTTWLTRKNAEPSKNNIDEPFPQATGALYRLQ